MSYLEKPSSFLKTSFRIVQGALPGDIFNKEKLTIAPPLILKSGFEATDKILLGMGKCLAVL